jgi:hypothetical protein
MGFATHATSVVKSNRALLKRRQSYKNIREQYDNYSQKTKLSFVELTPFQQKLIRNKIIKKAKQDSIRDFKISVIALFVILGFLGFLYVKYMA